MTVSGSLVQVNARQRSFQASMNRSMAAMRSATVGKFAAAQRLAGEDREERLDQVQPRPRGRYEVRRHPRNSRASGPPREAHCLTVPGTDDPATGPLALLRVNPPFRTLAVARVVSFTGDSLSLVALMLHVVATTGQALAVATLLLVGDAAPALLSPPSGAISDRCDRRRVMIACELVQAALLVA